MGSAGCAADRNEDQPFVTSSYLSGRVHGHCYELTWFNGHLFAVNDDPATAADDGVDVFGLILNMVMAHGLRRGRQLDLVHLEGTNPERFSDPLVERTPSRVRTPPCRDGGGIDNLIGHVTQGRLCRGAARPSLTDAGG